MIPIDLSGRIVVITGGSGQLGRVMAPTFARAGADVALSYYKNSAKAKELLKEIEGIGVRGCIARADVTDEKSVMKFRDTVVKKLGHADIIINNAVIAYKWVHVLKQATKDFESQFKSCVLHNVFMTKAFVPAMIKKGWGRVIAMNTECAMQCTPTQSAYASAKRGMDGVLRTLAREIAPHGITVNQVAPGWTLSENVRDEGTEYDKWYNNQVPMKRRGDAQEIANVVVFLASDLASFITGAYIPVCGGNVMPTI